MGLYVFVNEKYKMTAKILADSEDNARTRLPPLPPGEEWMLKENSTDPPWDEKPEPVWVPRGYSSKSKIKEDDIPMLILEEMDAFYEKLKEHIDWLRSYVDATQLIVNQFAFHDDIYWWKGMNLNEMQEKAERYNKFLREADKETIFNIGAAQHSINQLNKIQRACRQMSTIDVAHKEEELARLPHRILQILGLPTCPACGLVAEESPCPHCGNDVGMEYGTG